MKFSELKKHNAELQAENAALKSLHIEQILLNPREPKLMRVALRVDELHEKMMGRREYATHGVQQAARFITHFLFKEGVIKPREVTDPKTNERAYHFEMKVVP